MIFRLEEKLADYIDEEKGNPVMMQLFDVRN